MRSCPNVTPDRWLSRYDRPMPGFVLRSRIAIDFQPRRFDDFFGGSGAPWRRPNFSRLAREALRRDASRTFPLETAVLGIITFVAAWPIAIMVHEVIRLLR